MEIGKPGAGADDVAEQLQRTVADLRALGESVGAVPPGSIAHVASRRQLFTSSAYVLVVAAGVSWFVWDHWHSLLAAFAPLIWIVGHSLRRRQRGGVTVLDGLTSRIEASAHDVSSTTRPPASGSSPKPGEPRVP